MIGRYVLDTEMSTEVWNPVVTTTSYYINYVQPRHITTLSRRALLICYVTPLHNQVVLNYVA